MVPVIFLLFFTTIVTPSNVFEPTDLDKIFNSEGGEGALENIDEKLKAKSDDKNTHKDEQHVSLLHSSESTITCFTNPQSSEKKAQKAQQSYVISLKSLLSEASTTPASSSTHPQTSSALVSKESSSVLDSVKPTPFTTSAGSAEKAVSTSIYKTKKQPEESSLSFNASSVFFGGADKDEKEDSEKEKREKVEPGKDKYWTTVMAYGSPEKVLIGVKTITIIESIIREPAVSEAASKTRLTAGGKANRHETMKVGDMVKTSQNIGDLSQKNMETTNKSASAVSTMLSRPELAADMPIPVQNSKSAEASREKKTSSATPGTSAPPSIFTQLSMESSVSRALEKSKTAKSVQKKMGHEDSASKFSKHKMTTTVSTSYVAKTLQYEKPAESTNLGTESVHATKIQKEEEKSTSTSSGTSSEAEGSTFEDVLVKKDRITASAASSQVFSIITSSAPEPASSVMSLPATSKLDISSVRLKLSQIHERILKSLGDVKSEHTSTVTSSTSFADKESAEKEVEKPASPSVGTDSAQNTAPILVHVLSGQPSGTESRTSKSTSARKKASASSSSTVSSKSAKKPKEGLGGLGIWKRIGDFGSDRQESSKDTAGQNRRTSSTASKSLGGGKEGSRNNGRKGTSIVDILTVLNDISKKKEDDTKLFVDGDFQAKQNEKRVGNKFKFKGWVSSNTSD